MRRSRNFKHSKGSKKISVQFPESTSDGKGCHAGKRNSQGETQEPLEIQLNGWKDGRNGQPDEPAHLHTADSQVSPRTTQTKAPEHQWDDRSGGDADKHVQGEAITKYAFRVESGKTNVSLTIASVAGKQRIFKLIGLAHEITGVNVAQKKGKQTVSLKLAKKEEKTWHKLLNDASTKEAVADDTASSNTSITSRDFSKNLEEPFPTENEDEIDDQTRSMDSHEIQGEKEYGIDLRAETGTLFLPDKIVMEQHSLTHSPSQSWSKETEDKTEMKNAPC